jgi:polyisoprenoid-binding protein YceI
MKKLLLGLLLVGLPAAAQWKINPAGSTVAFKIKNAGITVDGKFTEFAATLLFDPVNGTGKFTGVIQAKSINTGINARDNHLRKAEYFDVASYPTLTFTGTGITKKGNGYIAKGNLTIKDVTQAVEIPFTFQEANQEGTFTGTLRIDRRTYHVGGNSWVMGDNVDIVLTIKATQTAHMTTN